MKRFSKVVLGLYLLMAGGALQASVNAPQPSNCVASSFSRSGDAAWSTVSLKITNNCGISVDFQNATVTFENLSKLATSFWGEFGSLSYPDNDLLIASQPLADGAFLASLSLHFPEESWAKSKLGAGQSIKILYGAPRADYRAASAKVYLKDAQPTPTGEIELNHTTAKPSDVSAAAVAIDLVSAGQTVKRVSLAWSSRLVVNGLLAGTYAIQPQKVTGTASYEGKATPASVTVVAGSRVNAAVSYSKVVSSGSVLVESPPIPAALGAYSGRPLVKLTRADTGAALEQAVAWNAVSPIGALVADTVYQISTPNISYQGAVCSGTFTPASLTSRASAPATTKLSYSCVTVRQVLVTLQVSGLPSGQSSVVVGLTPSNGSATVQKTIALVGGSGSDTVALTDGVVYQVAPPAVSAYNVAVNPQPVTAADGAAVSVTYQKQPTAAGGRIIGFLPGWKTPPSAASLASAGYTHIMVAFGVFSLTRPGEIVSSFDTVSKAYIAELHKLGLKVILSLGGALTSLPNTSVDFHEVLARAPSADGFESAFVQSVKAYASEFGFDGIDIDIEHGLGAGGSFTNPTGDIAVLARILNRLYAEKPGFLITLTPQVANIAATSGFDATWGNYAALVMQTYRSLAWVGVQLYNTGCAFGIDQVCYDPSSTNSPNFAVAMATDLLESWPAVDRSGRQTGFRPYTSYLRPDQVVIGFPAPDRSGASDGAPVHPLATIKRAIECLRTKSASAKSCATYVPPKAYPGFGGVFNWEVTYDQSNQFGFAAGLAACVLRGNCQ